MTVSGLKGRAHPEVRKGSENGGAAGFRARQMVKIGLNRGEKERENRKKKNWAKEDRSKEMRGKGYRRIEEKP